MTVGQDQDLSSDGSASPQSSPRPQGMKVRDPRWLQVQVCHDFLRTKQCTRLDHECHFAHPPPSCIVENGRVTACFDAMKVWKCHASLVFCSIGNCPQIFLRSNKLWLFTCEFCPMISRPFVWGVLTWYQWQNYTLIITKMAYLSCSLFIDTNSKVSGYNIYSLAVVRQSRRFSKYYSFGLLCICDLLEISKWCNKG